MTMLVILEQYSFRLRSFDMVTLPAVYIDEI